MNARAGEGRGGIWISIACHAVSLLSSLVWTQFACRKARWPDLSLVLLPDATLHAAPGMFSVEFQSEENAAAVIGIFFLEIRTSTLLKPAHSTSKSCLTKLTSQRVRSTCTEGCEWSHVSVEENREFSHSLIVCQWFIVSSRLPPFFIYLSLSSSVLLPFKASIQMLIFFITIIMNSIRNIHRQISIKLFSLSQMSLDIILLSSLKSCSLHCFVFAHGINDIILLIIAVTGFHCAAWSDRLFNIMSNSTRQHHIWITTGKINIQYQYVLCICIQSAVSLSDLMCLVVR